MNGIIHNDDHLDPTLLGDAATGEASNVTLDQAFITPIDETSGRFPYNP